MNRIFLYIDPQSGSLFFQLLLSGFLSVLVFFKHIKFYIKSLFSKKKKATDDDDK
jgi:hypothetical protein